jgi:D-amino-acid dehydrogenase
LLFRLRADTRQWSWGLHFLMECLPGRTRENTLRILRLALHSRSALQELRRETGIRYDHLEKGILHLHTDARELHAARARVALMQEHGCDMRMKSVAECLAIEPALANASIEIIGGTYAAEDESGDAHLFTRNLAALAAGWAWNSFSKRRWSPCTAMGIRSGAQKCAARRADREHSMPMQW